MPIMATAGEGGKVFTPAPEGVHQAVAVDVIDQGLKPNPFKPGTQQHKIDIAWQIAERRDDNKPYLVYKRYTLSLNEKATLRHDLESWRGKPFTRDEEMGFDVESIIGANCLVNIQHKKSSDGSKTFANVISVMPTLKGMPKLSPEGYERKTREQVANHVSDEEIGAPSDVTDDDIPFAWLMPLVLPALATVGMLA
jgi:hypothetical protein